MTLEVDNRIGHSTLPVGNEGGTAFFGSDNAGIPAVEAGKARQQMQGVNLPNFDFFNYAGITRPVHLYTTPAAYIADIALAPAMDGTLDYKILWQHRPRNVHRGISGGILQNHQRLP